MSGRTDAAIRADRRRVQRAALRAGIWVALASAVVVAALAAVTIAGLVASSRPDQRPDGGGGPGGGRPTQIVDLADAIPIAVIVGIVGVVALGAISWYLARRAAEPLAAALEVQRSFVADASHELRTPLTTLTSRIQLAQHRAERGGDVDSALADLRGDAAVMDAVLTDLLVTAESAGTMAADSTAVSEVAEVALATASALESRAAENGVSIRVDVPDGLAVAADGTALRRALTALLDNALRFSGEGAVVTVSAAASGRHIDILVADQGPGIIGIDPERVFDRFARAEVAGSQRGRHGFGLGLALVRDVAHRFGGSIRVERTSPAGTTFRLTLPAAGTS